jgi:glycosyltransferase involved in cell wall biosynthesis
MKKSQEYTELKNLKVALVHDLLLYPGGAERVLEAIVELFPEAPIYTLLYDEEKMGEKFQSREIHTSFLQKFPGFLRRRHRWLLPFYPVAVEAFDLRDFDLVISSSGAWSKGVVTRLHTKHVAYVHSPMRYVWDYNERYLQELGGKGMALVKRLLLSYLRLWDREAADRPDRLLANSRYTQARIEKYYRRESEVVYPPLSINNQQGTSNKEQKTGAYFLTVSRLTPNKKVGVIVDAFNKLGLPLVVAGQGSEEEYLRKVAADNVTVTGWQSEEELAKLYAGARGLVFAAEEDFGLVMAEALSFGVPVIAYKSGGAREIVEEGVTGEFFAAQTTEVLAEGVRRFLERESVYDRSLIRERSKRFKKEVFQEKFLTMLAESFRK